MIHSATYNYVRSRQLEGTYPGSPKTGVYLSTSMRVMKGWGAVDEDLWPYDGRASTWPEQEPQGIDLQAKDRRIGAYQRVNTVEEFQIGMFSIGSVVASFEIDDSWYKAPKGVIPPPGNKPITGVHCVCLVGYDNHKQRFIFLNSWGSKWGRRGLGFLPYSYLPSRFLEGWIVTIPESSQLKRISSKIDICRWDHKDPFGNIMYGVEIIDFSQDEMIAWGFAIERSNSLDLEELFVRPNWRRHGYGSQIAIEFSQIGNHLGKQLRAWIPHPDGVSQNKAALNKIMHKLGLSLKPSPVRWAAVIGE